MGDNPSSYSPRLSFLDRISSHPLAAPLLYILALFLFVAFAIAPTLIGILGNLKLVGVALQDPQLLEQTRVAVVNSFAVASIVVAIDLVLGIPLAWLIARGRLPGLRFLDTLVDMPLVMPTAAAGYSVLLFWSNPEYSPVRGVVPIGFFTVLLLHFTFTFPYVVRTVVGGLQTADLSYEIPARTLGASPLTTARTVTLPLIKPSIISALVLAYARSLSETGATMMVTGPHFFTGPVLIKYWKEQGRLEPLVFVSIVMILSSVMLLSILSWVAKRYRIRLPWFSPVSEARLSGGGWTGLRDGAALLFFFAIIIIPTFFIFRAATDFRDWSALASHTEWRTFWGALGISFAVAGLVTLVDAVLGIPVALGIARRRYGRFTPVVDGLVSLPILVPTVALGSSVHLLRQLYLRALPEFWAIVIAHISFTAPFLVKVFQAGVEAIDPEIEYVARTLGASPLRTFRTITLPIARNALLAGAILVFVRSVDETGATMAVVEKTQTAPVVLVAWVKKGLVPMSWAAFGGIVLVAVSFIALLIVRTIFGARMRVGG
ncbi:iron ABC transporter permease [archaeon]|nr:iron ABC transporter permease [archaeon]